MILGIDYGAKNIGLAIASGPLAEPLENIKVTKKIFVKIKEICRRLEVNKVVLGISEGKMKEETERFAKELNKILNMPIDFEDETLTTKQAITNLNQIAKKSKKRGPTHSYAATLILQQYLDNNHKTNLYR